jgi:DNA-binding response OmpR family regulator
MKKCVFICEDDEDVLEICKLILEKHDFTVAYALTCESMFNRISVVQPDLILLDLWVPKMGGEASMKKLRADAATRHIPVIIFSANNEIEKAAARLGADDFVTKPFKIKELLTKIRNCLKVENSPETRDQLNSSPGPR